MRRIFRYMSLVLYWISLVLISSFIYSTYLWTPWTQKVMNMIMWNTTRMTRLPPSYKCFQLFNNASNFNSFIDSKNGSCGFVTVAKWDGRTGNQMFEAAAVIGMAQKLDMIPVFNLKKNLIANYFNIPNTFNLNINNLIKCKEKGAGIYSDCSDFINKRNQSASSKNLMIGGYRQSWRYFDGAKTHVRNMFKFKPYYITEARQFITKHTIPDHVNVCIQVRRGDFNSPSSLAVGYAVAGADFISNAMEFYENKFKLVRFIVLSDDIAWCKQNIKGMVAFSPYKDPGVDLAIMSLCDHVIVTSGTFGWWGAWLSNGTVVYFHGFPRKDSSIGKHMNNSDYYPTNWTKL